MRCGGLGVIQRNGAGCGAKGWTHRRGWTRCRGWSCCKGMALFRAAHGGGFVPPAAPTPSSPPHLPLLPHPGAVAPSSPPRPPLQRHSGAGGARPYRSGQGDAGTARPHPHRLLITSPFPPAAARSDICSRLRGTSAVTPLPPPTLLGEEPPYAVPTPPPAAFSIHPRAGTLRIAPPGGAAPQPGGGFAGAAAAPDGEAALSASLMERSGGSSRSGGGGRGVQHHCGSCGKPERGRPCPVRPRVCVQLPSTLHVVVQGGVRA